MNIHDFEYFNSFFDDYVKGFNSEDDNCQKNIILKKEHTERVCSNMETIALSLSLEEKEMLIAKTTALFHDIGRFHQLKAYGTFDDYISINHAELSGDIIESSEILDRLPKNEKEIIVKAVRYHNRFTIPNDVSQECMLFSRLVRDADKLDIYKVLTDYYKEMDYKPNPAVEHDLLQTNTYSQKIVDDILNLRNSNNIYMKTRYDMRLITLTWVFDVNFKRTLELIKEKEYIDKTLEVLPKNSDMEKVKEALSNYMMDRKWCDRVTGDHVMF